MGYSKPKQYTKAEWKAKVKASPYSVVNCSYYKCGKQVLGNQGLAVHVKKRHPGWPTYPTTHDLEQYQVQYLATEQHERNNEEQASVLESESGITMKPPQTITVETSSMDTMLDAALEKVMDRRSLLRSELEKLDRILEQHQKRIQELMTEAKPQHQQESADVNKVA